MNSNFFAIVFFLFLSAHAQENRLEVEKETSFVQYEGKHLLHEWEGINKSISGVPLQDQESEQLTKIALVLIVQDFDSNNSGRDAHALEVLEALRYPEIKFFSDKIAYNQGQIVFNGTLDFHGMKVSKKIEAQVQKAENSFSLSGEFELIPSDFGIELPSFMTVKMKDLLLIRFRVVLLK